MKLLLTVMLALSVIPLVMADNEPRPAEVKITSLAGWSNNEKWIGKTCREVFGDFQVAEVVIVRHECEAPAERMIQVIQQKLKSVAQLSIKPADFNLTDRDYYFECIMKGKDGRLLRVRLGKKMSSICSEQGCGTISEKKSANNAVEPTRAPEGARGSP